MSRRTEPTPLSKVLRDKAEEIAKLLEEYEELRYGDELWRKGDKIWQQGKTKTVNTCEKCGQEYEQNIAVCPQCGGTIVKREVRLGIPPRTAGKPPQITVISSPRNIFYEVEGDEEEEETQTENEPENQEGLIELAFNPMTQAAIMLGEITQKEAYQMELEKRYNIITELGVDERRNGVALVPWLRKLDSALTYILETRELYSTEIKAVYPELLSNLETAIGTCRQLVHILGKQNGALTRKQYDELLITLLQFSQVARQAALQLADYHEEFMSGAITPFEAEAAEVKYVLEKEEKKEFKEIEKGFEEEGAEKHKEEE
jgi:hypothetical protein